MIRLLVDENFDHDLVRGVLRRRPELDLVEVRGAGLMASTDPEILAWAAAERRILLTHDVNTVIRFAIERVNRLEPMAGVFIVQQEGARYRRSSMTYRSWMNAATHLNGKTRSSISRFARLGGNCQLSPSMTHPASGFAG